MARRPTKLAVALVVIGVAGAVVAGVGPRSAQAWGFGVCVVAALILAIGASGENGFLARGARARELERRRQRGRSD
jgi:drug/metabolite transporter (DMT)-like permease